MIQLPPVPLGAGCRDALRYRLAAGRVSVLDGFVDPDPEADGPRAFP